MAIRISKAGIFDTVQDLGRIGYRRLGIGPGGALDRSAVRIINTLLGNNENAAVLEMHFPAPSIGFETHTVFAVAGADFGPRLNSSEIPNWTAISASPGDALTFSTRRTGMRAYLAVSGGLAGERWLGSASTDLFAEKGGVEGRKLAVGDTIAGGGEADGHCLRIAPGPGILPAYSESPTLRITGGPESHLLTALGENALLTSEFSVLRDSDRMGFRLAGPAIGLIRDVELVSSPVSPGTIQLLPDGNPVVLMAGCQTTGGYPRIGQVASVDLSLAAQIGPGDRLRFRRIEDAEAEGARCRFERDLCFLRMGIRLRHS